MLNKITLKTYNIDLQVPIETRNIEVNLLRTKNVKQRDIKYLKYNQLTIYQPNLITHE